MKQEIRTELTSKATRAYARVGAISMATQPENGQQGNKDQAEKAKKAVKKEAKPIPQKNPEEIKKLDPSKVENQAVRTKAQSFVLKIERKPLDKWSDNELLKEYKIWSKMLAQEKEKLVKLPDAFGRIGQLGGEAQEYMMKLLDEMEKRENIDDEFWKEVNAELAKEGYEVAGPGAGETADPGTFSDLRRRRASETFRGLTEAMTRLGEGNLVDEETVNTMKEKLADAWEAGLTEDQWDEAQSIARTLYNAKRDINQKKARAEFERQRREKDDRESDETKRMREREANKEAEIWRNRMERIFDAYRGGPRIEKIDLDPKTGELKETGRMVDKQEYIKEIKDEARKAILRINIHSYGLQEVLEQVVKDDELADMFLNEIIGLPDVQPGRHYDIRDLARTTALYSFRAATVEAVPDEKARKYGRLEELRQYLHDMKHALHSGNMRDFGTLGLTLNHEHFQETAVTEAVSDFNRWWDQAYNMILSKYGTFEPDHFHEMDHWVEKKAEEALHKGLLKKEVTQDGVVMYKRDLEPWELTRARTLGSSFMVAKLRAPELISGGYVAMTTEARRWQSYEYESAVRAFNPLRFLFVKFNMMENQGGLWLALEWEKIMKGRVQGNLASKADSALDLSPTERTRLKNGLAAMKARRNDTGFLTRVGSVLREDFEISAPQGRLGFEHGWRVTQTYLNTLPLLIEKRELEEIQGLFKKLVKLGGDTEEAKEGNEKLRLARHFIGDPLPLMKGYQDKVPADKRGTHVYVPAGYFFESYERLADYLKDLGISGDSSAAKERYMIDKLKPFVDQVEFYTGALVGTNRLPTVIKRDFWKKTARYLPVRIADELGGQSDDPEVQNRRLAGIRTTFKNKLRAAHPGWSEEQLNNSVRHTEEELRFIQEFRIKQSERILKRKEVVPQLGSDNILNWYDKYMITAPADERAARITFGREEQEYIFDLINLGQDMAIEFAAVEWPFNPYTDDFTYLAADYLAYGAEASRRRIADFDAGIQSEHAWIDIVKEPGQDPGKIREKIKEMHTQLDAPHGKAAASVLLDPVIEGYGKFIVMDEEDYKHPIVKGLVKSTLKEPKSWAQRKMGSSAPALGPKEMNEELESYARDGVLQRVAAPGVQSQLEKMRRKLRGQLWHYWWYLFRSWLPLFPLALAWDFSKQVREGGGR